MKLKRYIFPLIITVTLLFQKYYCISAEEIIDPYSDLEYNNICLNLTNNMVDEFTINISVPEKHTLSKFIVDTIGINFAPGYLCGSIKTCTSYFSHQEITLSM